MHSNPGRHRTFSRALVWLRRLLRSLGFGCFEIKLSTIIIESMYIGTSSDVTLQSQIIEMVEGRMLGWIVVGSECVPGVYGIQSLELGARGLIVGFVFQLSPFE
jgi:hypothetical protein